MYSTNITHTMYIHILYTDHIATQLYSKLKQKYQDQNIMNKVSFLKKKWGILNKLSDFLIKKKV